MWVSAKSGWLYDRPMDDFTTSFGRAELLALASSVLFAGTLVCLRQGMKSGTPLSAVLMINSVVSAGGMIGALYKGTLWNLTAAPFLWFVAMGLVGPGIGSISRMVAVVRMGLSPSTLVASSTPIWAVLLAVSVLGEALSAKVVLGTFCIVGGVSLMVFEREKSGPNFKNWFRTALVFPIMSSIAYAVAPIFTKLAYGHQLTPMLGLGIAFGVGNVLLLAAKPLLPGGGRIHSPRASTAWFFLGGIFNLSAAICFMTALTIGNVSSILPASRITPLWVLLFSSIFLRRLERVTLLLCLAAALAVAGGVMITVR